MPNFTQNFEDSKMTSFCENCIALKIEESDYRQKDVILGQIPIPIYFTKLNASYSLVFLCALICLFTSSCEDQAQKSARTGYAESNIEVEWRLDSVGLFNEEYGSFVSLSLINGDTEVLNNQGWRIYYNDLLGIPNFEESTAELLFENIAGDYHSFYPSNLFSNISPGSTKTFALFYTGFPQRKSFGPAGMYIVKNDGHPEIIQLNVEGINSEVLSILDSPTAESRFAENENLTLLPKSQLSPFFPRPFHNEASAGDELDLINQIDIAYEQNLKKEADFLHRGLSRNFNGKMQLKSGLIGHISLRLNNQLETEEYLLDIQRSSVRITGGSPAGVFYGLTSLLHLMDNIQNQAPQPRITLPIMKINDKPRFPYRGLQLDVSRNFHRKETVLKFLDLMAYYKINKFHFTLTNDEGWRIEIPGLPELTEIGAFRGHTLDESEHMFPAYGSGPDPSVEASYGSGFYTREDYIEILKYAKDRYIEVIPEIDLPGHARAAIQAMKVRYHRLMASGDETAAEQYLLHDPQDKSEYRSAQNYTDNVICVCRESAFSFTQKVIEEVVKMHLDAGIELKILHSGGDEVPYGAWQKSPICTELINNLEGIGHVDELHPYFLRRFKGFLDEHGIKTGGWEEIVLLSDEHGHHTTAINEEMLGQNFLPYVWNSVWGWGREDMAYKLANMGFEIVMCNSGNLYLDMAYNSDPAEYGLSWSGYADTKQVFSFAPENMFGVADRDRFGNALSQEYIDSKVKLIEEGRKNILGIQAQIWSETLRSADLLEYMAFPKLIAFAERAWSDRSDWTRAETKVRQKAIFDQDWNEFANMVGQVELPKLDCLFGGVHYRVPLPGVRFTGRTLEANVIFPGLEIRYSTVNTEPDSTSILYTKPVQIDSEIIRMKAMNTNGKGSREVVINRRNG